MLPRLLLHTSSPIPTPIDLDVRYLGMSNLITKQEIETAGQGFVNIRTTHTVVNPNVQERAYYKYCHLRQLLGSMQAFPSISAFSTLAMSLSDALADVDLCQNSVGSSRAEQVSKGGI